MKIAFNEQSGVEKIRTGQRIASQLRRGGEYSESLQYAHVCLDLSKQINAQVLIGESYNLIGLVYEQTEKMNLAEKYLNLALSHFREAGYASGEANALINLALVVEDPYEKVELTLAAIEPNSKTVDTTQLLLIYSNLSYHYFLVDEYEKSLDAVDKGLSIIYHSADPEKHNKRKGQILVNMCENLIALEQYNNALVILDSIKTNEDLLSLTERADMYRMYATAYEELGVYREALNAHQHENSLRDSLFQLKTNEEVMKHTIKAEKKVLKQKNEILNQENEISDLELKRQKFTNYVIIMVACLLVVVLIIIGYSYTAMKAKNKKLVATNQELVNVKLKKSSQKNKQESIKSEEKESQDKLIAELVERLKVLLEEDEIYMQSGLSMEHLAKKIGTNRTYMSMAVNQLNSSGFVDLINELRIMKFCELLADPEFESYTIQYIANEVGFHSQPTFNNAFKKFTGVTPSFYLKELKKMGKSSIK
ncbi:MAG: helix-turn-helix domain-containing protein [Crocinitomicaceae bacterium]